MSCFIRKAETRDDAGKKAIWHNPTFYLDVYYDEAVLFINNAEGRIAIFNNGGVAIHCGHFTMMEDSCPDCTCCKYTAIGVLEDFAKTCDGNNERQDAAFLRELASDIKDFADDMTDDQFAVAKAVDGMVQRRGYGVTVDKYDGDLVFVIEYAPKKYRHDRDSGVIALCAELNAVAKNKKSKISFELVDDGDEIFGFKAVW